MTTPTSVTDSPRPGWWRRYWWLAGLGTVLAIAAAVGAGYVGARNTIAAHDHTANADEQAMAARAAAVMPFDLNATTHTFIKNATGGVEQVVANDPGDRRNITLIRQHLLKEAEQFTKGNYSDPATIHGTAMPGLRELQAGADRVEIHHQQVPSGARITYSSSDPALVAALHTWFDAQNSDHAMPGMGM
jgi:hypothetical protein